MVATAIHFIIGMTIAWFFGIRDKRKYWYGLIGAAPDIDGIIFGLLLLFKQLFDISLSAFEHSQTLVNIFAHRGMSHSIITLGVVLGIMFLCKAKKQTILIVSTAIASHLFFDAITAWKFFPLLPLTYTPVFLSIVEIFDPILTFLTMMLFGYFVGNSITKKVHWAFLLGWYVFVLFFGFLSSFVMGEYNVATVVLSQGLFWLFVVLSYAKNTRWSDQLIKGTTFLTVGYLLVLFISQLGFAFVLGTSMSRVEPLEEFAFNFNAHTFEIDQGDSYRIGIISFTGFQEDTTVPKIIDHTGGISQEVIEAYQDAYRRALYINWFNNPIFNFHQEGETTFVNIRYAKSYLNTPFIPGPQNGLNATLVDGMLVGHHRNWLS